MGFWQWVTSGWGDALASYQHPITALENSFASVAGLPQQQLGSQPATAAGSGNTGNVDTSDADDDDDSGSWKPWVIAVFVLVGLFLVVAMIHEIREV